MTNDRQSMDDLCLEIALLNKDVDYIKNTVGDIKQLIKTETVSRNEFNSFIEYQFNPIKRIAYTGIGVVVLAVLTAILESVIR